MPGKPFYSLVRTFGGIALEYKDIIEAEFAATAGIAYVPPETGITRRIVAARTLQILSDCPVVVETFQTSAAAIRLPANTVSDITNDAGDGRMFMFKNSGTGDISLYDWTGVLLLTIKAGIIILCFGNANDTWDFPVKAENVPVDNSTNGYDAYQVQKCLEEIDFRNLTIEPTGFTDRTQCTMSFTDGTLTFRIAPVSTSFSYYIKGHVYTKTAAETVPITDTEGLWFITYNYGVLTATQTPWQFGQPMAFVSFLYWDSTNKKAIVFAEERHGLVMDWATHKLHHMITGLQSQYGGYLASNYIINGDGSLNTHAQLAISNGTSHDEDLIFSVVNAASPVNPFEQKLSTIAYIPIYYRTGSGTVWRKLDATAYPVAGNSPNTCYYNKLTAGSWALANVTNNWYFASWLFVTNNINEPIICIMGQKERDNLSTIVSEDYFSGLDLTGLPFQEMQLLYRCFFKTSTSYTNTPKATLQSIDGVLIPNVVPSPVVNYTLTSATPFSTTSVTDQLITGFTLTPQSGTYACWFSCDAAITANNNLGQCVFYKAGAATTDSRRTAQGSSSNFQTQMSTMSIITFNGSQAIDVRVNISVAGNNFTINQRSMVLIRLGA